jgi:PIN domain nuclease of toxin-antitoxin system
LSVRPILLDTCAFIWLVNGDKLTSEAVAALAEAEPQPGAVTVSPISGWEIGQLVARGRLRLPADPASWFEIPLRRGIALAAMPPAVLIAASFLPSPALRDPADRIIAATARAHGYRLMTRDRLLLDFAAEGHAQAIAC